MRKVSMGRVFLAPTLLCVLWSVRLHAAPDRSSFQIAFASGAPVPDQTATRDLHHWASHQALRCWSLLDKRRGRCDITVSSYSDSLGSATHNHQISATRAYQVIWLLQCSGLPLPWLHAVIVGAQDFLVPPSDCPGTPSARRVCEARNRRVLVTIRVIS